MRHRKQYYYLEVGQGGELVVAGGHHAPGERAPECQGGLADREHAWRNIIVACGDFLVCLLLEADAADKILKLEKLSAV